MKAGSGNETNGRVEPRSQLIVNWLETVSGDPCINGVVADH